MKKLNLTERKLPMAVSWVLIVFVVLVYGLPWLRPANRTDRWPGFAMRATDLQDRSVAVFQEESINPDSPQPTSHVASLCELPNGRLAAAWYSGSREGGRDMAIYFATRDTGEQGWSQARAIVTREAAANDLKRYVKRLGNAVLFSDDVGHLWLLFGTVTIGGWSGSSLNLRCSYDEGRSWSTSRRLTTSPIFNMGELARNRPVLLADGGWAVPIYQELIGRLPELLWLPPGTNGEITKTRIQGGRSGYQPSLLPLGTNVALAFLRDFSTRSRISFARTETAGRNWLPSEVLSLPNPDASITAVRLSDGRLVLVFNDSDNERSNLRLAVSADEGRTWTRIATLAEEKDPPGVCYPYAIQTRDGQIHVVYTWRRTTIKHQVFNEAWLRTRQAVALK